MSCHSHSPSHKRVLPASNPSRAFPIAPWGKCLGLPGLQGPLCGSPCLPLTSCCCCPRLPFHRDSAEQPLSLQAHLALPWRDFALTFPLECAFLFSLFSNVWLPRRCVLGFQISAEGHFLRDPCLGLLLHSKSGLDRCVSKLSSVCNGTLIRALVQAVVVLLTCCPQLST